MTTTTTTLPSLTGSKFEPREFNCKCGQCGLGYKDMAVSTIVKLLQARDTARVPFRIRSAIRCQTHNKSQGGRPNSAHTRGFAVDIGYTSSSEAYKILTALQAAGFNRIGHNGRLKFFHVDDDPSLPPEVFFDY